MSEGRKSRVDVMATKVTPVKPTINVNIMIGDGQCRNGKIANL